MAQNGPKMAPRWPKMAPSWPQDGPKMAQDGANRPQDGPKTAPSWSKMAPRRPKTAPSSPQDGPRRRQDGSKSRLIAILSSSSLRLPAQSSLRTLPGPPVTPQDPPQDPPGGPPDAPKRPLKDSRSRPQIAGNGGGGHSPSGVLDSINKHGTIQSSVCFCTASHYRRHETQNVSCAIQV